jgi:hypothetical protein
MLQETARRVYHGFQHDIEQPRPHVELMRPSRLTGDQAWAGLYRIMLVAPTVGTSSRGMNSAMYQ